MAYDLSPVHNLALFAIFFLGLFVWKFYNKRKVVHYYNVLMACFAFGLAYLFHLLSPYAGYFVETFLLVLLL